MQQALNKITLIKKFTENNIDYYSIEIYIKGKLHYESPHTKHYSYEMAVSHAKGIICNLNVA